MSNARDNILGRLRERNVTPTERPETYLPSHGWTLEQKIQRMTDKMQSVRAEVHDLRNESWSEWLNRELPLRKLNQVLVGNSECGQQFLDQASESLNVQLYTESIESWKPELFERIDVGITSTKGAIAETGSLILWPNQHEPRLMSLVPPVHIAVLKASKIEETFAQAMQDQGWASQMPTNALLISGPSKTADIEQTLAYGIHGPKQLIVLII